MNVNCVGLSLNECTTCTATSSPRCTWISWRSVDARATPSHHVSTPYDEHAADQWLKMDRSPSCLKPRWRAQSGRLLKWSLLRRVLAISSFQWKRRRRSKLGAQGGCCKKLPTPSCDLLITILVPILPVMHQRRPALNKRPFCRTPNGCRRVKKCSC